MKGAPQDRSPESSLGPHVHSGGPHSPIHPSATGTPRSLPATQRDASPLTPDPGVIASTRKHTGVPPQEQGQAQVPCPYRPRTAVLPQRFPSSTAPTDLPQTPSGSAPPFFVIPSSSEPTRKSRGNGEQAIRFAGHWSSLLRTRRDSCQGNGLPTSACQGAVQKDGRLRASEAPPPRRELLRVLAPSALGLRHASSPLRSHPLLATEHAPPPLGRRARSAGLAFSSRRGGSWC